MPSGQREDPFNATNFRVEIDGIAAAGFLAVSGIEADVIAADYRNGNDKTLNPRKLPGEAKYSNIALKRGLTSDLTLWKWMQDTLDGKLVRKNMSVVLLSDAGEEVLRFNFTNAWPVKWSGPNLNAETNEIAIETLEITHEGLSIS
jgi:phage tail-like protein